MIKHFWYLILISFLIGQEGRNGDYDNYESLRRLGKGKQEKMEMMMVWRLTEALDLSTEQAEKFFPRFRDHRKGVEKIRLDIKENAEEMKYKIKNKENLTENDVIKAMGKVKELRKKIEDAEFTFLSGMSDILRPDQLASLGLFKQRMLNDIKGELKDSNKKDRKREKKRKWNRKRNRRKF